MSTNMHSTNQLVITMATIVLCLLIVCSCAATIVVFGPHTPPVIINVTPSPSAR